ncbi:MAG: SDR family oxidoreductase [Candidatus Thorarchaeota archaeon]
MKDVKEAINLVEREYEKLHILINCAASYEGEIFNNVVDTPEDDWERIIDVNLNGYYRFCNMLFL